MPESVQSIPQVSCIINVTHLDSVILIDDEDPLNEVGSVERNLRWYVVLPSACEPHHSRYMRVIEGQSTAEESVKYNATRPYVHCGAMIVGTLNACMRRQPDSYGTALRMKRTAMISGLA
jgi:hypothetical protein